MDFDIVEVNNGCVNFKGLIDKVLSLEEKTKQCEEQLNSINEIILNIDDEIRYLLKADDKTGELLQNHADTVKKLEEYVSAVSAKTNDSKLKLQVSVKKIKNNI